MSENNSLRRVFWGDGEIDGENSICGLHRASVH
jgi:hypothetical protein